MVKVDGYMSKVALKFALTYFISAYIWIFSSDYFLSLLSLEKEQVLQIASLKGVLYVTITSFLFLYLINRYSKKLKDGEQQYKKLFEEHPNPMWICDKDTLEILGVNNVAVAVYGFSRKEFLSMTIKDLHRKENNGNTERPEETVTNPGRDQYTEHGISEHQKKNGDLLYVQIAGYPITFDNKQACLVLALDIHEKYMADQKVLKLTEELQEREIYLNSLIDSQSNFLIRTDLQGNYNFVNKAFCSKYGYVEEELIGHSFMKTIFPEDYGRFKKMAEECVGQPGKVVPVVVQKHNREGIHFMSSWEFVAIQDANGDVKEIQGVGQDVTQEHEFYKQLTKTKERLENILSTTHDIVWSARADDLRMEYINPSCKAVSGYIQQEYYHDNLLWMKMVHPEDQALINHELTHLSTSGWREFEHRIIHKDGTIRYIYKRMSMIEDKERNISVITGTCSDITPKKIVEAQARENTRIREEILESITDGFYAVDKNWNFTYVNKECERLLGVKREDLLDKNVWACFPESVHLKIYTEYHRVVKEQISVKFEVYYPSVKIWFKVAAYPIQGGLAAYFQDVTQEKELRLEVEKSERNLTALINNTEDMIWLVDADLRLLSFNHPFHQAIKVLTAKHIQRGDHVLMPGAFEKEVFGRWEAYYQDALEGKHFRVAEKYPISGETVYVETSFNPIINDGTVIGISCIAHDITESKKSEARIRQHNDILMEIAHTQSHELRRPVATIMGLITLFDKEDLTSQLNVEVIERIMLVCEDLDKIIHKIVEKAYELK